MPQVANNEGQTMADEFKLTGVPLPPPAGPPLGDTPSAIRAGSPGSVADTINISRVNPPKKQGVEKPPEVKDSFREIIETIVFVVVLVLMLKTYLAEAFVIPTGSMATTLL